MTNEKKDKIKDKIFIWICVGLIAIITLLAVLFYNTDSNVEIKNESNIQITNDNLLKSEYVLSDYYVEYAVDFVPYAVNNDNTSGIFDNVFNEGSSLFTCYYLDENFCRDYISNGLNKFDLEGNTSNFKPYVSISQCYQLYSPDNYDDNKPFYGWVNIPYWTSREYFTYDADFENFVDNTLPNNYIRLYVDLDDYFDLHYMYIYITFYFDISYLIGGGLSHPTFIIPSRIENDLGLLIESENYNPNNNSDTIKNANFYFTNPVINSDIQYYIDINTDLNGRISILQNENSQLQNDLAQAQQNASSQYARGYQNGLNDGAILDLNNNGMKTIFNSILSYPINFLSSVFNFEFFGINVASLIFFLISTGIVLWIIKRLWK